MNNQVDDNEGIAMQPPPQDYKCDFGDPMGRTALPPDFVPAPYTVVIGRGKYQSSFIGNKRLRVLAITVLPQYAEAKQRSEKTNVITSLVNTVRDACPVEAFVKFKNGRFWPVSESMAREKVGYFLRDLLQDKYRSSSKSKSVLRHQMILEKKGAGKSYRSSSKSKSALRRQMIQEKKGAGKWLNTDSSECSQKVKASDLTRRDLNETAVASVSYPYASIDPNEPKNGNDTSVAQSSADKTLDADLDNTEYASSVNRSSNNPEYSSYFAAKHKNENSWDGLFREILAYLQKHGDCYVPQGYPRNPLLSRWVSEQRNDYDLKRRGEKTSMTPLREAKLDAIGFSWFIPCAVRPQEVRSESKVRSENVGVASPDCITSG
jgi:hypothetical protein